GFFVVHSPPIQRGAECLLDRGLMRKEIIEKRLVALLRSLEDQLHPRLVLAENHGVVHAGKAGTSVEPVVPARTDITIVVYARLLQCIKCLMPALRAERIARYLTLFRDQFLFFFGGEADHEFLSLRQWNDLVEREKKLFPVPERRGAEALQADAVL